MSKGTLPRSQGGPLILGEACQRRGATSTPERLVALDAEGPLLGERQQGGVRGPVHVMARQAREGLLGARIQEAASVWWDRAAWEP